MDIIEFQNKLKDIQTLALNNGKQVRAELVEKFFGSRIVAMSLCEPRS